MAAIASIAIPIVASMAGGAVSGMMGGKHGGGGGGQPMPQAGSISQGQGGSVIKNAAGPMGSLAAQLASRGLKSAFTPTAVGQPGGIGTSDVNRAPGTGMPYPVPDTQAPPTFVPPPQQFMPPSMNPLMTAYAPESGGGYGYF